MSHRSPHTPSPSQYQFSLNPSVSVPRCSLVRPFSHKTTINAGYLYPLYVEEVLPGDTFNVNASIIARLTTPMVPFMDNVYLDMHFFYVPYRLVWENFTKMHGEQDNPGDPINYTMPQLSLPTDQFYNYVRSGELSDYLGIPINVSWSSGDIHSLVHRAYNLIWNQWYRDENLQNSVSVPTGDGPDAYETFTLLRRNKRKDYFTSALPWPQKGDAVQLAFGGTAPVMGNGLALGLSDEQGRTGGLAVSNGGSVSGDLTDTTGHIAKGVLYGPHGMFGKPVPNKFNTNPSITSTSLGAGTSGTSNAVGVTTDPTKSGLVANLDMLSGALNINDIRTAFQVQKLLERSARGGTRYTELLYSFFGVQSPDSRLQRPELLGALSVPVTINAVPQTSETDATTPQGNLAAYASAVGARHAFDKSFVEFGVVIGLASVRCDNSYQQGIPRMYSRNSRYDFYYPPLAHLGEQAILNKELYLSGDPVVDNAAFGYQERWSEYKYSVSRITGQLRSTYAQSLDVWHLAQKFNSLPTLGSTFIEENPPLDRVLAITDVPQFVVDTFFDQNCVRPMPLYSIPGLVDHF